MSDEKIKVYYDGLCLVCSKEINHYMKMKGSEFIDFIDITSSTFDAEKEQLDPKAVHKELHAKDSSGQIFVGVDTFILIWSKIEKLKFAARWAKHKPINMALNGFYKIFVHVRPYLPRRECADSPYCDIQSKKI